MAPSENRSTTWTISGSFVPPTTYKQGTREDDEEKKEEEEKKKRKRRGKIDGTQS